MNNLNLPLVSIVIPTYKRNDKILLALESALNQSYENIEIIVVDDNEPESEYRIKTKNILKKYIDNQLINYIESPRNLGGSASRNLGINIAKGEFIAFLDDDDIYYPDKIKMQYNYYIEQNDPKIGLVYCYVNGVNDNGELISSYRNDFEGFPIYESMMGCIAGTSSWFCPKKVLVDIGGFEITPSKQDTITIMKLISKGYKVCRVCEVLLDYYEYIGNKISGTGINSIIGENNSRNFARKNYHLLQNNQEVKNIELNYSKKLLTLYLINKDKKSAKIELLNMININVFNKSTLKGIIKYYFLDLYIIFLKVMKKRKYN